MFPASRLPDRLPSSSLHGAHAGDTAIRQTDTDAACARLSAARKGYVLDPFIKHLVPRANTQPIRPPLINVGTYLRGAALDALVAAWLARAGRAQIVSLGAGSDTRFWRISTGPQSALLERYIELDFEENTIKKAMAIRKSKELSAVLGNPDEIQVKTGGTSLHSPRYHILPADLRNLDTLAPLFAADQALLLPDLPTLLIFECVLVYMQPAESDAVLRRFADYFHDKAALGGIVYEMFNLGDPFGRVMLNNLSARGVSLPGSTPYTSRDTLPERFLRQSFDGAQAVTLRDIRYSFTSAEESARTSQLEMLDEVEELDLVLDHYAITWGYKASSGDWATWGLSKTPTKVSTEDDE